MACKRRVTVRSISQRFKLEFVIIVVLPLLVRLAENLGWFLADPVYRLSRLTHSVTPGLPPGVEIVDPNIDFTTQALGYLATEEWFAGQIPWWNPHEGARMPLASGMQSVARSPLALLPHFPRGLSLFPPRIAVSRRPGDVCPPGGRRRVAINCVDATYWCP